MFFLPRSRTFPNALLCAVLALVWISPGHAQQAGQADAPGAADTAEPLLPDMAEIEQAWARGDYETARAGLGILAETTDSPMAYYRYGRILAEGRGGPQDFAEAARWLEKAIARNHLEAATLLAQILLTPDRDTGPPHDPQRALSFLELAAARGDTAAQYSLARLLSGGRGVDADPDRAGIWLLAAAEKGHAAAQFALARRLLATDNPQRDVVEGRRWLQEAAENNHTIAAFFLARAYESGADLPADPRAATQWYLRAAEAGMPLAQRLVAMRYMEGTGTPQDIAQGLAWLQRAASAGEVGAMTNLGYAHATGTWVPRDMAQAVKWYRRAVEHEGGRAMLALGRIRETGADGAAPDLEEAIGLYTRALGTGDARAAARALGGLAVENRLGDRFAPHRMVPWVVSTLDPASEEDTAAARRDAALDWLRDRAGAGLRPAQTALAGILLDQEETAPEGARWLRDAARAGDVEAQVTLGRLHTTGTHVPLDYVAAHAWFNIAATFGVTQAAELRDTLSALMTAEQIAAAQAQARTWFETEEPRPPATEQTIRTESPASGTNDR